VTPLKASAGEPGRSRNRAQITQRLLIHHGQMVLSVLLAGTDTLISILIVLYLGYSVESEHLAKPKRRALNLLVRGIKT